MPGRLVLITGGAGFIGSHLTDELLENGYGVRVLDSLHPQVHGEAAGRPAYLDGEAEFIRGDIRDRRLLARSLKGVDSVVHLAAAVGVGQSMYEIARYTSVNDVGTALLLESLAVHPVERLIVASSMSIYGEGLYREEGGRFVEVPERSRKQLEQGVWEHLDERGSPLVPVPTRETKIPAASSVYALSKFVQERLCLIWGQAYRVPTAALRFFNVYGPRQALSNPYTGVLAIFSSRLLNDEQPLVFEDGRQLRDFVNVHDVARACRLALESPQAGGEVFNIGRGEPVSILDVARELSIVLDRTHIEPDVVGRYRVGDVRHCYADISRAKELLGYQPEVTFTDGLAELAGWLTEQVGVDSRGVEQARDELVKRGLVV